MRQRLSLLLGLLALWTCAVAQHDHYVIQHYSIKDGMSQNTVMAILQDKQGYMWFGTWDGLNRFDGYTFETFKAMNDGVEARVNNRVDIIYEDEKEQLWWATYDGHFYRLDRSRKVTTEQPYDSIPEGMLKKMEDADKKTQVDPQGIIWQADDKLGIMRYRFGQWKRFTPPLDSRYEGRLREHFFMLTDRQGRTWVNPTGGGWSYYDYEKDELVCPLRRLTNMIHTAYVDNDGQMWISTYDGGVDCVNMEPTPYTLHDMRRSARDNGEVRAFVTKKNGDVVPLVKSQTNVYCAVETEHGLLYGTKGEGLRNVTTGELMPTNNPDIYDIEVGRHGTLFVATYGGGVNIFRWNRRQSKWDKPTIVGQGMKVRDIEVVDQTLWCGTTTGILRISLPSLQFEVIPSYDIRAIYYSNSKLWLGTFGGGLNVLDPKDSLMQIEHVETFHDIILSMAGDGKNLWFTSESDIAQLNIATGELHYYDALDGERNTYFTEAEAVRQANGTILFGYSNGYCAFDPSRVVRSTSVPAMRITRCVSGEEVLEGDSVKIADGSSVTIEYAAMDYVAADKLVYYYKMDGIDKDWNHARDVRRVTYNNLNYGHYVFHVRSTNREGADVDNEKTLHIFVSRPWGLTWWAIAFYVIALIGLIILISYIISTYNKLRQKVQVEQQVTDIKLRFFTNISHELRTPLTLIVAPVENILQTERINQSVRSQLEIVHSNSQRMLRMVNQLLEFRKIQNQKMKLKVQPTLLSELAEETGANFKKEAYDKHISFTIENKATDSTVWVDRTRMDTVLWNLLSNAFKFTPAGKSIRVVIDEKPGFVTLAVSDEGIGIPLEKRSVLFERFSSNNELSGNNTTGTGIGMNLVKELVDLHHGHIEVESEVGKGSTFTILLHTGKEHFGGEVDYITDDQATAQQPAALTLEDRLDLIDQEQSDNRRTILVVDDSQDMRQFLVGILSHEYNVLSAEDGEEAEHIIRTQQLDLIITDLMMPKIDGLELTQFIKKNPDIDYIPVILLTAKTAIESRLQALQYGADDYVTKPFEPEYLRARVRNIISQREQLEQSYRQRLMRLEPQRSDEQVPGDTFLAKLLDIMEKQMDNNTLTVDELVEEMGMGRTVFFNKLKSLTGLSPVEFIREMRIKRAAQLLEDRQYNITEVTYMVGMNDSRYFAKCFKATYGVTPSEYRKSCLESKENK
ncbi:MAG: response regulator [Paludibacteraceae bacterium]|nr:response regulator [Paludibacteraceae bacterium]